MVVLGLPAPCSAVEHERPQGNLAVAVAPASAISAVNAVAVVVPVAAVVGVAVVVGSAFAAVAWPSFAAARRT